MVGPLRICTMGPTVSGIENLYQTLRRCVFSREEIMRTWSAGGGWRFCVYVSKPGPRKGSSNTCNRLDAHVSTSCRPNSWTYVVWAE